MLLDGPDAIANGSAVTLGAQGAIRYQPPWIRGRG